MAIDWSNMPVISGSVAYVPAKRGGDKKKTERKLEERIMSLDNTILSVCPIVAHGIPVYIDETKIDDYAEWGITEYGWYAFAKILGKTEDVLVTDATTITGASGYKAEVGNNYVEVAISFEVAAMSKIITVAWTEDNVETFHFSPTDLAIRNLDYRVTFYVYDIEDPDHNYAHWEYTPATDAKFVADKRYYTKDGDTYTLAEVTADEDVPPLYYEDKYELTTDEKFATGKVYYTKDGETYTAAEVTVDADVPADTYYEHSYVMTEDTTFATGKTYYTKSGTEYTAAEVTAGEAVPTVYYVHSKVTFSGMTRNITYVCNTPIDCPSVFDLPEIEDETHGCWFEIRFRHTGSFSSTLKVPEGVKVATEHTQAETAGINMVDLHYTAIGNTKVWRFMNTHSSIPA